MEKHIIEIEGTNYKLLQEAYMDGYGGDAYYTATAVNTETGKPVHLRWEIKEDYEDWMEESVACDWHIATVI